MELREVREVMPELEDVRNRVIGWDGDMGRAEAIERSTVGPGGDRQLRSVHLPTAQRGAICYRLVRVSDDVGNTLSKSTKPPCIQNGSKPV